MKICGDAEKDKSTLAFHDVDLLIYTVCGAIKDVKPDKQLCRHEFWEILVRMSKVKFIEKATHPSKKATSLDKAVEMLIDKHFKQNRLPLQGGQKFRDTEIW